MAQICHMRLAKVTFLEFGLQFVLTESIKHLAEVKFVLVLIVAIYQDIVQIHQNELVNEPMHNRIHQTLEGTGGVTQAQRQNRILKQAIPSYKRGFLAITRC